MLHHLPGGLPLAALPCCTGQACPTIWRLSILVAVPLLILMMGCQVSKVASVVEAVLHCL